MRLRSPYRIGRTRTLKKKNPRPTGRGDNENVDYPNLLLIFDPSSLSVQCVLDKAIFLTGVTQSGANIVGGTSTKTVGCDVHKPGVGRQRLFPAFRLKICLKSVVLEEPLETRCREIASVYRGFWWAVQGSNLRPPACKAGALTN
jgi:hypothetical protein